MCSFEPDTGYKSQEYTARLRVAVAVVVDSLFHLKQLPDTPWYYLFIAESQRSGSTFQNTPGAFELAAYCMKVAGDERKLKIRPFFLI